MKKNWKTWLCSILVVGATLAIGLFAGCTADDFKEKIDQAFCEHNYGGKATDVKAATCTAEGEELWTCIECGKEKTIVLEKVEHTVASWVSKQKETCREEGIEEGKCSSCKTTITRSVEKLKHDELKVDEKAPTCTVAGHTEYSYCKVCNDFIVPKVMIPALGHDVVIDEGDEATCTDTGLTDGKYCQREGCNEVLVEKKKIPALGHKIVYLEPIEATCEDTGLTAGYACERCDKVYTEQKEIPLKDHVDENDDMYCDDCFTLVMDKINSIYEMSPGRYRVYGLSEGQYDIFIRYLDDNTPSLEYTLSVRNGSCDVYLNSPYAGPGSDEIVEVSLGDGFIDITFRCGTINDEDGVAAVDIWESHYFDLDTSLLSSPVSIYRYKN